MSCCEPSPEYAKAEAERKAKDDAMMATEVTLNGTKLQLKDLFPDCWAARDFYSKLQLINKTAGGKSLMDESPSSIMEGE